jgi:hypothetical protein
LKNTANRLLRKWLNRRRKNSVQVARNSQKHPSGAEARLDFAAFTARLKSRPDTELTTLGVFPQPVTPDDSHIEHDMGRMILRDFQGS